MPETMEFIWLDFLELNNARTSNGYTLNPISYQELYAWTQLTGKRLKAHEIGIIKMLDITFLNYHNKQQKLKKGN